jgi:hypothetical protein
MEIFMPIDVDVHTRTTLPTGVVFDQSGPATVSAFDDVSVDIAGNAVDQAVAVQPGPASAIVYLVIQVNHGTADLSYKAAPVGPSIPLAGAHVYSGPGMAGLLGTDPTTLYFTNAGSDPVPVRILVMRSA